VSTNPVMGTSNRRRHRSWPESLKREIVAPAHIHAALYRRARVRWFRQPGLGLAFPDADGRGRPLAINLDALVYVVYPTEWEEGWTDDGALEDC
jgi:hypothetical protein